METLEEGETFPALRDLRLTLRAVERSRFTADEPLDLKPLAAMTDLKVQVRLPIDVPVIGRDLFGRTPRSQDETVD
ncbi:hypothetical protein ACM01_09550 [Streptomyces viridochromogenes]|uniref:Uncharacterized protein n=1 Tax=Streptomyces viridochromogenes TaxID=1938 RepID=A0A0J7ZIB2_STRVR|nr:hypothetical protein [Streptomyces viridochromogenes]KMS75609.1 hypothetical protein ACM01_09550 [Streptomyces viridochromogenes]KOG10781.1 hypothetical protein ADK36_37695 [Streptomyces viridochromogenes]KOG12934.1 hypothetical protein ADK35_33355 [Streptomyces viridochromogenes]